MRTKKALCVLCFDLQSCCNLASTEMLLGSQLELLPWAYDHYEKNWGDECVLAMQVNPIAIIYWPGVFCLWTGDLHTATRLQRRHNELIVEMLEDAATGIWTLVHELFGAFCTQGVLDTNLRVSEWAPVRQAWLRRLSNDALPDGVNLNFQTCDTTFRAIVCEHMSQFFREFTPVEASKHFYNCIPGALLQFKAACLLMEPDAGSRARLLATGSFAPPDVREYVSNTGGVPNIGDCTSSAPTRISEVLLNLGHVDLALQYCSEQALEFVVSHGGKMMAWLARGHALLAKECVHEAAAAFEQAAAAAAKGKMLVLQTRALRGIVSCGIADERERLRAALQQLDGETEDILALFEDRNGNQASDVAALLSKG